MINKNSKKAISVMIGYILLVSFAVIMGTIIYAWLSTYVPGDGLECSDGTSLFIKDYDYDCTSNQLSLTIINNGRFNVGGYFIKASNSSNVSLATIDISGFVKGDKIGSVVKFPGSDNSFKPGEEDIHAFNLSGSNVGEIYSVEIIPIRWQLEKDKRLLVSCEKARVTEVMSCS